MKRRRRKRQRGGALFRRKPRLVDKIAEGASMVLSGPAPTFASLGAKLVGQASTPSQISCKIYTLSTMNSGGADYKCLII